MVPWNRDSLVFRCAEAQHSEHIEGQEGETRTVGKARVELTGRAAARKNRGARTQMERARSWSPGAGELDCESRNGAE